MPRYSECPSWHGRRDSRAVGPHPGESKRVLSEALSARVQPTVPIRPAGTVPVVLKNPMVNHGRYLVRPLSAGAHYYRSK